MKNFIFLAFLQLTLAEEIRLLNLDPPEAQQYIDQQDTSLKYAPKIESNVPAVRFLGNEPHNVAEDIYLANQYHGQDGLGGYLYGYSVPDIAKTERKQAGGDLRGAYNYIAGNGQEIKVEYWDDGTGFHQVDNVPKVLPQQIEDTPEVKAAKDEFARIWQEEAERNSKPVQDPYDNHAANVASQGQSQHLITQYHQQKQQFPNPGQNIHYQESQNPAGYGGQYQASQTNTQYAQAPGSHGISGGQASGNSIIGGKASGSATQFGSGAQNSYESKQGNPGQYGGAQAGSQFRAGGNQASAGQYGGSQAAPGSGQFGAGGNQASGQYGGSQAGSGNGQFGAGGNQASAGQYGGSQATPGSGQFGAGGNQASGQYGGSRGGSGSGQFGVGSTQARQYGGSQATPGSGQFGTGANQASGQYGGNQAGSFGAGGNKAAGGRAAPGSGQFGAGSHQASGGQYGAASGKDQFGAGGQYGVSRSSKSESQFGAGTNQAPGAGGNHAGSGQIGASWGSGGQQQSSRGISGAQSYGEQASATNQYSQSNEGQYNDQANQEEQGPPKGFFYSFDYPVGIIVSKGGPANLKDLYNKNKDNFEKQLQTGQLAGGSRGSTGYAAA